MGWKSNKESKQGKDKPERWNGYKTLIVYEEVWVEARGTRTLVTQTYSLACSKAKLHPNQHDKGGTKPKGNLKEGVFAKGAWTKKRTTTSAYIQKTCYDLKSSQLLAKSHCRHIMVSLWPFASAQRGRKRHHSIKNKKRCQVASLDGPCTKQSKGSWKDS